MRPPHILIVEDDDSAVFGYTQILSEEGYEFEIADSLLKAKTAVSSEEFEAVLLDLNLPDGSTLSWIAELRKSSKKMAIIVITGESEISVAVQAMKSGADNYLVKPVDMDELQVQLHKYLEIANLRKMEAAQNRLSKKGEPFWGESLIVQELLQQARVAAESDTPILLQGETGTGKGVMAKWIHNNSLRNSRVFVDLNCSTTKGDLLKSELFGHTKGAFTSAIKDREGLVESADGGTLFLDEIGDMDTEVQSQLLKVIEDRTFRRLGENKIRKSDFRLICATNKDIKAAVHEGVFREDLYYRISVFPLGLPPLRKRKDDLHGLSDQLLKDFGYRHGPLDQEVLDLISSHNWPGNVRELKNSLERGLLLSGRGRLSVSHFPDLLTTPQINVATDGQLCSLEEMEIIYIKKALGLFKGNKNKVCEALGISLSSLYRKIPKLQEEKT